MKDDDSDEGSGAPRLKRQHLVWVAFLIVGGWVITPLFLKWYYPASPALRGLFGDMFGAVNALFTGVALLGAIWAILLQTEELELQRKELKKSTEEFARQNEILAAQLNAARAAQAAAESKERLASMPFLRFRSSGLSLLGLGYTFENVGADIYDIRVSTEGGAIEIAGFTRDDMWRTEEKATVSLRTTNGPPELWGLRFEFTTKLGVRESVRFEVAGNGSPRKKDVPPATTEHFNRPAASG